MGGAPRRPKFVRSGGESAAGSNGFFFLFAGGSCDRSFRWSRLPPTGFKGHDLNVTRRIRAWFPAKTAQKTRGSRENAAESRDPPPVDRRSQRRGRGSPVRLLIRTADIARGACDVAAKMVSCRRFRW